MESEYKGLYSIIGPPGTGKTTFLAKQVNQLCDKGLTPLICSLTTTAAREIASRDLPVSDSMVGTLHSLAYRAIGYDKKLVKIKQWNKDYPALALTDEGSNIDGDNLDQQSSKSGLGDRLYNQYSLYRHKLTPKEWWTADVRSFAKKWTEWKLDNNSLDFTDMIEECLTLGIEPMGKPDIVIADEVQDFSKLEYDLLKFWGVKAGAMMACGDGWQSLYSWRGADPDLLNDPAIPDDHRRVLGQSWRIPRAVHARAIEWIKRLSNYSPIDYKPRDFDGKVSRFNFPFTDPEWMIKSAQQHLADGKSVMIMASCSYMLIKLITQLREYGIYFSNPWRKTNYTWNPVNENLGRSMHHRILSLLRMCRSDSNPNPEPWTVREFMAWTGPLSAEAIFIKGQKSNAEKKADELPPNSNWTGLLEFVNLEAIKKYGELLMAGKQREVINYWQSQVKSSSLKQTKYPIKLIQANGLSVYEQKPKLYVGTIHSFKGAEADVVYVAPDLSPVAQESWNRGTNPELRDSIIRAFYVAMTRAKETLYLCDGNTGGTFSF